MKAPPTMATKAFLLKNYMVLFIGTIIATSLLGSVVSTLQMRSVHGLYLERLNKVLALHENEFLNEIALQDRAAIAQHLDIVRSELAIDSIKLETNDFLISSTEPIKSERWSLFSLPKQLFFEAIGVKPLALSISNDFESVGASLIVVYSRNFSDWVVAPFLNVTYMLFVFTLLTVGFIFALLFRKIDRHLIKPLQLVTESFRAKDPSKILDVTKNALGEIQALSEASGKLREAERSIAFSEIAHQVAHDIRSPLSLLNVITSEATGLSDETRKLLGLASARIDKIAAALLDKYRREGAPNKPNSSPVLAIAERIALEKQAMHRASGAEIRLDAEPSAANAIVGVDPTELGRAFSNLIENGIEACTDGAARVAVRLSQDKQGNMLIAISDNGRGIEKDFLRKVGQRGATSGKTHGNGLGVYHAKSLTEASGGKFTIESEVGKGTTIRLTFPRSPTPG